MSTKGLRTRQEIVGASLQLFSVKGYFNTSISDILQATGLTKGGLYGHFGSKDDIWHATYEEAVKIWKKIVLRDARSISDPIIRIQKTLENDLEVYLGGNVFEGGCFFLNMLVELSGQSNSKSSQIMDGMLGFSQLLRKWLIEADEKQMLKSDVKIDEISNFILIALCGCAALYTASKNIIFVKTTVNQCINYIEEMRK
ncbi:MAG: TetR/AcrR family transcriptional regulator [Deltaproteobacteria bacterium]|nr:TetR/AcrR family transcriptional regulator [Deltaproteobacteria bacterium]